MTLGPMDGCCSFTRNYVPSISHNLRRWRLKWHTRPSPYHWDH